MPRRTRPSVTAVSVASVRAGLERPTRATGDVDADVSLARSLRWLPVTLPGMRPYLAARTEFFDGTLLAAEAPQVVLVGAGYDGRSLRFRQPGVEFFEVDHPVTQADKRARLDDLGIDAADVRFVPVDFGHDDLADALAAAGHDRDRPTHFLCEGVTPYLPRADLEALVGTLAGLAAPGSSFAVDFAEPRRPTVDLVRFATAMVGERIVTMVTPEEATALLLAGGWDTVDLRDPGPFPTVFAVARTELGVATNDIGS